MSYKKTIKVPNDVSVYYFRNKNILIVKNKSKNKAIKLKLKLEFLNNGREILVLTPVFLANKKIFKYVKALKGLTASLIKKSFLNVSTSFFKKLKIVGVGYKVFVIDYRNFRVLHLKLGYSHSIYIRVPCGISVKSSKSNVLFIFGASNEEVQKFSNLVKKCKKPEPYKGKGIFFDNETIKLKVGKVI